MARKTQTTAMTPEERKHREWHHDHAEMDSEAHDILMKRLGVTEQEHEVWHRLHRIPMSQDEKGERVPVDIPSFGARFIEHCVSKGWLVQEGRGHHSRYYPTREGKLALREFGIDLEG